MFPPHSNDPSINEILVCSEDLIVFSCDKTSGEFQVMIEIRIAAVKTSTYVQNSLLSIV